jgi:hypothetical protein
VFQLWAWGSSKVADAHSSFLELLQPLGLAALLQSSAHHHLSPYQCFSILCSLSFLQSLPSTCFLELFSHLLAAGARCALSWQAGRCLLFLLAESWSPGLNFNSQIMRVGFWGKGNMVHYSLRRTGRVNLSKLYHPTSVRKFRGSVWVHDKTHVPQ